MPAYQHPGVYIEEIPSGAKAIEGVATSVAAFVGWAERGPLKEPVLIQSPEDYERVFGSISGNSDNMGLAVNAFYMNGGKSAYVLRLADSTSSPTKASAVLVKDTATSAPVLRMLATTEGEWGNALRFRVIRPASFSTADPRFTLEVGRDEKGPDGVLRFKAYEVYPQLSMNPDDRNYAITGVNGSSQLVQLELDEAAAEAAGLYAPATLKGASIPQANKNYFRAQAGVGRLAISLNGLTPQVIEFEPAFDTLAEGEQPTLVDDGHAVAEAIAKAVQAVAPAAPFSEFVCQYVSDHFELKSEASASSSVAVTPGFGDAAYLGLGAGATSSHGVLGLTPDARPQVGAPAVSESLSGGAAIAPTTDADFRDGFAELKKVRDISIVVLPDNPMAAPGETAVAQALAHCMETGNRVLIVDPPQGTSLKTASQVDALGLPTSSYAVCYYPWVKIQNPAYHPEKNPTADKTIEVAPSAFMAGLWSRIDGRRGVWKAPAGVEAALTGVAGLADEVGDGDQDQLNPLGINCIRKLPSYGPVVWGARTLATKADPEWRYVPVRRTAIMIEQSIYNGIQWAVFEPNDHRLWAALRVNVGSFMEGLFRAGAFQGEKASDAYFVRCGLGDTMTQGDVDRGQVIVLVGFAPLKPAEFVIVRIQQKLQQ